jgi:hypothetical protein
MSAPASPHPPAVASLAEVYAILIAAARRAAEDAAAADAPPAPGQGAASEDGDARG